LSFADCKLRTGLSRKYLIPFLNKLKLEGYVKRNGDDRVATGKAFERPDGTGQVGNGQA
jgi:hypothetical protein